MNSQIGSQLAQKSIVKLSLDIIHVYVAVRSERVASKVSIFSRADSKAPVHPHGT